MGSDFEEQINMIRLDDQKDRSQISRWLGEALIATVMAKQITLGEIGELDI